MGELEVAVRGLVGDGEVWVGGGEGRRLEEALVWTREKGRWAVLAGSLYLVADLYRLLEKNTRLTAM